MKQRIIPPVIFLLAVFYFTGCKKEFDMPPVKHVTDGTKLTIAGIKSRFNPAGVYTFHGDTSLYCVVTADETSGNLYKDVYVRDASGALHVKFTGASGLFVGDSIRIRLNNVLLNSYADLVQLDSVDAAAQVIKLASGLNPQPEEMTLEQIITNAAANTVQSRLVKLSNVEFSETGRDQPFANGATKAALQYTVQDCSNHKIALRTSGYSYFANRRTPGGNGSLIAIVSQYYSGLQLIIRSPDELTMNGGLCPAINPTSTPNPTTTAGSFYLAKDFNDNSITSGGWSTYDVFGSIHWSTSTKGGAPNAYGQISNYVSSANVACESWLISPVFSMSTSTNPTLSFRNACNYTGPPLIAYVSTDYVSGPPSSATWTQLAFTASTGGFTFVGSGNIALAAYKVGAVHIAFKYTGTATSGATWEIDDLVVKEN